MFTEEIYRVTAPYREPMIVKGYRFGKGDKAACILGPVRGNEIQQLYICSQLVHALRELEHDGLVTRREYLEVPVRVEYGPTDSCRALLPILEQLSDWAEARM